MLLASGIVSQVSFGDAADGESQSRLMVDASVSYGSSGGGVYEARGGGRKHELPALCSQTGELRGQIVTGAEFGWWHGAQALQTLVAVDRKVERKWGVGRRSELVARNAQAYVRRHER